MHFNVEDFYIFVLVDASARIVGFFSKEKISWYKFNLACILVFPEYRALGYGVFLIALSYALSKREGAVGAPEEPLSDQGLLGFRSYWTYQVARTLVNDVKRSILTMEMVTRRTCIREDHVLYALQSMGALMGYDEAKKTISVSRTVLQEHLDQREGRVKCPFDERYMLLR